MKTANVYTADGSQQLQAVAFYTVQEDQPYTVDIYRSVSGKDPTNGTQIKEASVSGNFAKTGYHTVQIPKEVRVADGEKFSVVITYATVDDSACVPLEGQNDPQNGHCYSASAGQSYTYFAEDAKWYDNTAISVDGVQYDLNNACIKVFGNPADEPVATLTPTATPTVAPGGAAANKTIDVRHTDIDNKTIDVRCADIDSSTFGCDRTTETDGFTKCRWPLSDQD